MRSAWASITAQGSEPFALEIENPQGTAEGAAEDTNLPTRYGVHRIHGELLKLGIDVGQTIVPKYIGRDRVLCGLSFKSCMFGCPLLPNPLTCAGCRWWPGPRVFRV